jgi:outer membrane protein TolC
MKSQTMEIGKVCLATQPKREMDMDNNLITRKPMVFRRVAILMAASGILLSGCTLQPESLSTAEMSLATAGLPVEAVQDQEPVISDISLYEAMARALKYNLDHQVELRATQLAESKYNLARYDMLPDVVANADKTYRDKAPWSVSETLSGVRSAEHSTSSETAILSKDLTFSWHVLDFGLSYVRAKQAANHSLIASEQRRKVVNSIIENVRTAYWRAVTADRLLEGFNSLENRVEKALSSSRSLAGSGMTSPVAALTYQRELVDIKKKIQRLDREFHTAKFQLAALMNLPPDQQYRLVVPERKLSSLSIEMPSDDMVLLALENRPEMRELAYRTRITADELKAATLEMLPGIQVFAGGNYNSNDYLLNSDWLTWGAKASWNLMKVFRYPAVKKTVAAEQQLNHTRTLAMTMAIMTQVEVSRARYFYLRKSAATSGEYHNIQQKILRQVRIESRSGAASEQSLIREEMNALVASAELDAAFADLQNAFASVYQSIGIDPWGDSLDTSLDVKLLAEHLRNVWQERGDHAG